MFTIKKIERYMNLVSYSTFCFSCASWYISEDERYCCELQLVACTPLVRLGQEKVPAHSSSFEPTVYSDDTITDEEEEDDDDGEYSVGDSYNSDDSDESGEGLVLKIFVSFLMTLLFK